MKKILAIIIFVFISNSAALGQNNLQNIIFERFLNKFQNEIIPIIMADRPQSEQDRIDGLSIRFLDDIFLRGGAFANSDKGEIVISSGFMWGILLYSEAFLIEAQSRQTHFREWYFTYLLWRHPSFWDGATPKTPAEFSGLSNNSADKILNNPKFGINNAFSAGMNQVLLHELGHLALGAIYSPSASNKYKNKQESRADEWAIEAAAALGDKSGIGSLFALGYLNELERFGGFKPKIYRTHPSTQERFTSTVAYWCNKSGSVAKRLCGLYQKELNSTFSQNSIANDYRKRVSNGEVHAMVKMGDLYMAGKLVGKDTKRACINYMLAYKSGKRDQAALNYGWCLGHGHLGQVDRAAARSILTAARHKGWIEAQRLIDEL